MSFLEVIVENLDHYPDPGPEKKGATQKQTRWKNWTSRTKNVATCFKSNERQC